MTQLIVTDLRMPGRIDGMALADLVSKRWPQVRIVIVSGHARLHEHELPADAFFLNKPYKPSQLLEVVGRLLPSPSG